MRGRTVVLTGASGGIGFVAAERLAEYGANVVLVGRSEARTRAAARAIENNRHVQSASSEISYEIADLVRQRDVHDLARSLSARRIDVLVNNAGALFAERQLTPDGLERTFALNHLAPFTLTLLLLPHMAATSHAGNPGRVITVASRAHVDAKLDLNDLQGERSFRAWRAYNNSKLENILFTRALSHRLNANKVVVHALHPGLVATQFAATGNGWWGRFMRAVMNIRSLTPAQGADTMIWLASADESARSTGGYWVKRVKMEPSPAAQDNSAGQQLWRESVRLSGIDADALVRSANGV